MKRFLLATFSLVAFVAANAATYYVDYTLGSDTNSGTSKSTPLKRFPGMATWSGTVAAAPGDNFVAKGGETWPAACYPWTIPSSGSSGLPITYTVDNTWYSGGAWSRPIFDANHTEPSGGMMKAFQKSYITVDSFYFKNYGTAFVGEGKQAIDFLEGHHLAFTNNKFECYCWVTLYIHFDAAGTYSTFDVSYNECSNTGSLLWFADAYVAGRDRNTLRMIGNVIHDFSSQIGNDGNILHDGTHSDGFIHSFGASETDNVVIANNQVYGDFRQGFGNRGGLTSFIFLENHHTNVLIYGNDISPSPVAASMGECFIHLNGGGAVYNNTLNNPGVNSVSAGFHFFNSTSDTIVEKNNIITGLQYAVYMEGITGTLVSDYNLFNSSSGNLVYVSSFQSYSAWQAAGRDVNGLLGTAPTFTNSPSDTSLSSSSAGLTVGANLTSLGLSGLNTDRAGTARPPSGTWRPGAYQGGAPGSGDTTAPTPNPSTISSAAATGATTVVIVANTATDASSPPVQYAVSTDNGSSWSAWQSSATFNISGLTASTTYQIKVKARDSASTPNETTPSSASAVTTNSSTSSRPNPKPRALTGGF